MVYQQYTIHQKKTIFIYLQMYFGVDVAPNSQTIASLLRSHWLAGKAN
jgi:hypothetical protein